MEGHAIAKAFDTAVKELVTGSLDLQRLFADSQVHACVALMMISGLVFSHG